MTHVYCTGTHYNICSTQALMYVISSTNRMYTLQYAPKHRHTNQFQNQCFFFKVFFLLVYWLLTGWWLPVTCNSTSVPTHFSLQHWNEKPPKIVKPWRVSFLNTYQMKVLQMVQLNPALKVSAQKVSGHKVSKIDNIGQIVSSQNYLNKDNEHYLFFII